MKRATSFCFLILIGMFANNYSMNLRKYVCCLFFLQRKKGKNKPLHTPLHDGEEMQMVSTVPVRSTVPTIPRHDSEKDVKVIVSAGHFSDDASSNEKINPNRSGTPWTKASVFEASRHAALFEPESGTPPLSHVATQTLELDSLPVLPVPNNSLVNLGNRSNFENISSFCENSSTDSLGQQAVNSSKTFVRDGSVSSDGSVVVVLSHNQATQVERKVTFKE